MIREFVRSLLADHERRLRAEIGDAIRDTSAATMQRILSIKSRRFPSGVVMVGCMAERPAQQWVFSATQMLDSAVTETFTIMPQLPVYLHSIAVYGPCTLIECLAGPNLISGPWCFEAGHLLELTDCKIEPGSRIHAKVRTWDW